MYVIFFSQKSESKSKNKKFVNIFSDEGLNRQEVFLKGIKLFLEYH